MSSIDLQVAERVRFAQFCQLLDKLEKLRGQKKQDIGKRRELLKQFIDNWRKWHKDVHGDKASTVGIHGMYAMIAMSSTRDSFYPAMRLLLPLYDKDRGAYGVKETMLASRIVEILGLSKDNPDALKLRNYKAPGHVRSDDVGDFGAVAMMVMKDRESAHANSSGLTLARVNELLDSLVEVSKEEFNRNLLELLKSVKGIEVKWLCRILLKQVKLGVTDKTLLKLYHEDAESLYDVTSDLERVCRELRDPSVRLDQIQVQLFSAFRPMLCNRVAIPKVSEIMDNKPFFVELKYDGERVQLHKKGDQYRFFSRNGNDFTNSYGATAEDGPFTKYVHCQFGKDVKSCILDGEMVGWCKMANCIATKGQAGFDVKWLTDDEQIHPCFVAFDCIYWNDKVLTQLPLTERMKFAEKTFTPLPTRLLLAERKEKSTTQDIVDALNEAIEGREEGIVLKRPDSTYRLNTRSNEGGWLKIKPDYVDNLMDDLDLIVVGGYHGDGKRGGLLSHFLLGVAADGGGGVHPTRFKTVAKVGSGYSNVELYELNVRLRKFLKQPSKLPDWIECASDKPDVWIEPKNSVVLQIRAAEIVPTSSFATRFTPRFPRVERIRADKDWFDCMTFREFEELRAIADGKIAQARASLEEAGRASAEPRVKKQRLNEFKGVSSRNLASFQRPADVSNVKPRYEAFLGKEFCIKTSGRASPTKQELELSVAKLGGKVTQSPGLDTFCVVADSFDLRIQTMQKNKQLDIVKPDWLIRCIAQKRILPWSPSDMWSSRPETKATLDKEFDAFGDSYTEPVTSAQLKQLMANVLYDKSKNDKVANQKIIQELESAYVSDYKFGVLRSCRLFCEPTDDDEINSADTLSCIRLKLVTSEARLYGALLVNSIEDATHVLLHSSDLSRLEHFHDLNRRRQKKLYIVTEAWIRDCITHDKILDAKAYYPFTGLEKAKQ